MLLSYNFDNPLIFFFNNVVPGFFFSSAKKTSPKVPKPIFFKILYSWLKLLFLGVILSSFNKYPVLTFSLFLFTNVLINSGSSLATVNKVLARYSIEFLGLDSQNAKRESERSLYISFSSPSLIFFIIINKMKSSSLSKPKMQMNIYNNKDIFEGKKKSASTISTINQNNQTNVKKSNTLRHNEKFKTNLNYAEKTNEAKHSSSLKRIIGQNPNILQNTIVPSKVNQNEKEENKMDLIKMKLVKKIDKDQNINPLNFSNPIGFYNKQKYKLDMNYIKNLRKSADTKYENNNKSAISSNIYGPKRSDSITIRENEDTTQRKESQINKKLTSPRFELILDKYCKIDKNVELKKNIDKKVYSAKPVGTPKKKNEGYNMNSYIQNNFLIHDTERDIKTKNSNLITDRKLSEKENTKGSNILSLISNKINKQLINSNSTSFTNFNFKNTNKSLKSGNLPSFNNINLNNINININLDEKSLFTELSKKTSPKAKLKESQGSNFNLLIKGREDGSSNIKLYNENQIFLNKLNKSSNEKEVQKEINQSLNLNLHTSMKKKEEINVIPKKIYSKTKVPSKSSSIIEEDSKLVVKPDSKRYVKEKIVEKKLSCKNILTNESKVNKNVEKKVQSQSNSPSHFSVIKKLTEKKESMQHIDDLLNNSSNLKFKEIKQKEHVDNIVEYKHSFKINLNHVNKSVEKDKLNNSLDNTLNTSNCSVKSTMRESHYYKRESEKIASYIKNYHVKKNEYPPTTLKFYKFGRLLGKGAFGKVNLCLHTLSGRLVAIKSFNKALFKNENSKKKILYEINLMKNIKHHNTVKIFESFETQKYLMIVMENVCGGDLLSFLRKRTKLNETTSKFIFRQIIEALHYIHSLNIVHRDIKLDNILIDLSNNIKICDYGVSKYVKKGETMYDQCGTPAYIAPEILRNNGYEGFSVDFWSAGVVLYAMLTGTVPFKANNMNDLHKLILKGEYNEIKDISDDALDLLTRLLEVDPKKRLNAEQILNHQWLRFNDTSNGKFKSKMNLFTIAEKILLSKLNVDYKNANKDDLIEHFTMKNIDTQKDLENQNINTKSQILAPFNSSLKKEQNILHKDLKMENQVMKMAARAKEANRNYELNNNGEIDNGILINPQNVSYSNNNSPISSFRKDKYSKPVSPQVELNSKKMSNINSPNVHSDSQRNYKKGINGSNTNVGTFVLDENIIKMIEELGYKKEYLVKSLYANELTYATATYYLLLNSNIEI